MEQQKHSGDLASTLSGAPTDTFCGDKHSPGPWHVDSDISAGNHFVMNANGYVIASLNKLNAYRKKHEANARLIAAAPELLFALETLTYLCDNPLPFGHEAELRHRIARAHAAIARATGSES